MTTTKTTETAQTRQGDLDDLPGTYTLDDGHTGSYDHEAAVSVGDGAVVTVACSCGEWEQVGEARFGDEGDTAVLAAWERHVYQATGRGGDAARPKCDLPDCENVAIWRGTCSPEHHREMAERRRAEFFWGPLDREGEARVYGQPAQEVQRVDALDCRAPAGHRIGDRLVCTGHRLEVLHAYWETDSNLALFEVDETAGYRCGETFPGVQR